MNTIPPLTPFQRGQAALHDALARVGYPEGSDERTEFVCGLCEPLFGGGEPQPELAALVEAAVQTACAELVAQLVQAKRDAQALQTVLKDMGDDLAPIVAAHLRGQPGPLAAAVAAFVAKRCKLVTPSSACLQ